MLRLASSALALAAVAVLSTACIIESDDGDSDFTIYNESSYIIDEINLAEVSQDTWGPDLLRGDPLFPGDSLTIVSIECGRYDVRVTDETGVRCELGNIDLCFDSDGWVVDDLTLDVCAFNP
jgi:hypothetical protein